MNSRGVLLVGVLCTSLVVIGIGTRVESPFLLARRSQMTQTEQIGDAFTKAVVLHDLNQIGELAGADPARGTATEQIFGILGAGVEAAGRERAGNLKDYHWTLTTRQQNAERAELLVHLSITNFTGIAEKVEELLGYRYTSDGQSIAPDELKMSATEANRLALQDTSIKPLQYEIPLFLVMQGKRWIVDPKNPTNGEFIEVIQQTTYAAASDKYRVGR